MGGSSALHGFGVLVDSFRRWINRGSIVAILNWQTTGRREHGKSKFNVYPSERIQAKKRSWVEMMYSREPSQIGEATISTKHRSKCVRLSASI